MCTLYPEITLYIEKFLKKKKRKKERKGLIDINRLKEGVVREKENTLTTDQTNILWIKV